MSGSSELCTYEVIREKNRIGELRIALAKYDENYGDYSEISDEKLLGILQIKDFDVDRAAEAIKRYERFLKEHGRNASMEDCSRAFNNDVVCVLKHRDCRGRQVILFKARNFHPNEISLEAIYNASLLIFDEMLLNKLTRTNGMVWIVDFKDVGYQQMLKQISTMRLLEMKRLRMFHKGGSIIKTKWMYALNAPFAARQAYNVFKIFASKKMNERTRICDQNSNEFISNFRKDYLPKCLGGELNDEKAKDLDIVNEILAKLKK